MEIIEETSSKQFVYAGFWNRFAAYLIDRIVLSAASLFILIPLLVALAYAAKLSTISSTEELMKIENLLRISAALGGFLLFALFNLVLNWLYYALMESSKYQGTLGKLALGVKVTDYEGNRIGFGKATGRYFARIITNMTMLIGYIIAGFTDRKQALHDMVASCLVVKH
ncbi:MAG: RDD family protein [Bacteroidales bacterium]|jgi:uncharacterized RDD family membrane protein YckC|nr:RDD family protein [Bacteroidales bacterium]MDD4383967.1 RDD family protein [Bacteroidales bacterium]MDY0196372.1 RDD family protein [Tenuifilaceae bacterium]